MGENEANQKLTHASSTCVISIVRLFTLRSAVNTTDATWDNVPTSYWTVVELNCGILCACLPTLRPFLRRVLPSVFPRTENSSRHHRRPSEGGGLESLNNARTPKRGKPPRGMYTITGFTNLGSAEGLKENAATYEVSEYANYPGNQVKLTTSIYGSRDGVHQGKEYGQEISVTTEIGRKESMKQPYGWT